MNIEAYNLDSLRRLVRSLQDENKRLKQQLDKANIPYETENMFAGKIENTQEYDPEGVFRTNLSRGNWQTGIFPCSGAEPTYMQKEERKAGIFRSVIIAGITAFAQSSRVRSKAARYVNIGSGQSLHRRNS